MEFQVKHEIKGRIRIHLKQKQMTTEQSRLFLEYITSLPGVSRAKTYGYTADAVIYYTGARAELIQACLQFRYDTIKDIVKPTAVTGKETGETINQLYQRKLLCRTAVRMATKFVVPLPVRMLWSSVSALRYILRGLRILMKHRLEVEVLDAVAIAVSILRKDWNTAGSIMFLLGIGELLEEWTHKKSVFDLADSMSLNIERVWKREGEEDVYTAITEIKAGDLVRIYTGNIIPLDGNVVSGTAMVNEASLTGESLAVKKEADSYVYAGTVVEEGECLLYVTEISGTTRFEKIIKMIEESEKLKSTVEGRADELADRLVPLSLAGTVLTYFITRNPLKALAILMVDFSCALKLAMPISVLSAMREAARYSITVKGGKYLEAIAQADTIVFDKTGTLTKAQPKVADIITFGGNHKREMLRLAACLEEHFPHSVAKAVLAAAEQQNLLHHEIHSKVEYIVAHGIASSVNGERVVIGSYHFAFEDEKACIPTGEEQRFDELPGHYSHLYLCIAGYLAAVICIEDPLREEAQQVIQLLRQSGISKIVMMTGDSERTAAVVARSVGIDEYYSEVLPEDKAAFIEREKEAGRTVVMIGDGINDSPALSAADVGIAISEGAELAREIADITIAADNLAELVTLKNLSDGLLKRIHWNYQFIISFNLGLIILGVGGVLTPSASALLHNASTLGISLNSMTAIRKEGRDCL